MQTQTVKQEHLIPDEEEEEEGEVTPPPTTTNTTTSTLEANTNDDKDAVDNDPSSEDSFSNNGLLQLPPTTGNNNHNHQVPNCCAICLGDYSVGDTVIWSSNPSCQHAFHDDCILEWLLKMQPATPCPCCRQEFTDLEDVRREKKVKWTGTNAFNLQSIGL